MYKYSIYDFPFDKYNSDRLSKEIFDSQIIIGLGFITGSDSIVSINFKSELSASEKTILDNIIANHSGEPMPYSLEIQQVKIAVEQPRYIESGNSTQEFFCAESLVLDIPSGPGITSKDFSWPFNIGTKSATFIIADNMVGDEISVTIAPNTVIGNLIQNLNIGDTSIRVSPTAIKNIKYGQYIGLATGQNLGRVTSIEDPIIVFTPASSTNANAGSYINMCAKIIPYAYFNAPGIMEIGKTVSTINRIPANVKIRIDYKNNSGIAKKISFLLEYLY